VTGVGVGEGGSILRDEEVTRECEFQPSGIRGTIDGADKGRGRVNDW